MKIIKSFALVVLVICSSYAKHPDKSRILLNAISKNQQSYVDQKIVNKADFKPIIDFASKGRLTLYRKYHISFDGSKKYILLEGIINSTGRYIGIVFSDKETIFYDHKVNSDWQCFKIDKSSEDSIIQLTGIGKNVIDRIRNWDVNYIDSLKHSIGGVVSDGFSFLASQISQSNAVEPVIETVGFYEFP